MENSTCTKSRPHKDKRNRVGIIFLVIGLVLLGNNLNLVPGPISHYMFSWPMLLLTIGFILFIMNRHNVGALIMMGVGGIFLWNKIEPLSWWQWKIAWPGLFILVGLVLIFAYLAKPSAKKEKPKPVKSKKSKYEDVEFDIDKIEPIED